MPFTRRTFIQLLSAVPLLQYPLHLLAAPSLRDFEPTLIAFVDTLMPADDSPAASEVGVHQQLLNRADGDRRYNRLLLNGCLWLENIALKQYNTEFRSLAEQRRITIVELIATGETPRFARIFFNRVQDDLFEIYYSQPGSWRGLGIDRPPQPIGYMNYNKPPATSS